MNRPDPKATAISHERITRFVQSVGEASGLVSSRAEQLARLLVTNDLRGVTSHGSIQICAYARLMRDGALNPKPEITVIRETPVSLLIDGDGGLGYFAAYEGTERLTEIAAKSGIAVLVTRNHGHFGAAGIYARMPLKRDLFTFVTSGHQLRLNAGDPLYSAAGGSPMAFGVPNGDQPPLVVDFGCMHDLYSSDPHREDVARLTPGLVLRSIGLGEICQIWGGVLSGLSIDGSNPRWSRSGANQGSLVIAFRTDLFADPEQVQSETRSYIEAIRRLTPLPGFDESFAAGVVEAERETEYRRDGIPVSEEHLRSYSKLAEEFGVAPL
jgi:L-2-hydroxycarboxylate dehydrogenase (NAD+)